MKMYSNEKPVALHNSGGVWFFNANPELIPALVATDDNIGVPDQWSSDSIAIEGEPSRDKLIAAGMAARYSKDAEIAVINNKLMGDETAYATYSAYRSAIKSQVDAAGFPKA